MTLAPIFSSKIISDTNNWILSPFQFQFQLKFPSAEAAARVGPTPPSSNSPSQRHSAAGISSHWPSFGNLELPSHFYHVALSPWQALLAPRSFWTCSPQSLGLE